METPLSSPISPAAPAPPVRTPEPVGKNTGSPKNNKNNTRNIIVFCVILLLVITNILLLFKVLDNEKTVHRQEKVIVTTRVEKDALYAQLDQEKKQFERLKTENTGLNKELGERNAEIKAKIAQIESLLKHVDNGELGQVKQELLNLRKLNDKYIEQVALLKKENKHLTEENTELSGTLQQTKSQNENLAKENTALVAKVTVASVLRIQNLKANGVRYRSSGKEVIVSRAGRVQKIKACFTILENKVIEKGPQSIFLRIIGPDGTTWSTNHESMNFRGTQMPYSLRQEVNFENHDLDICMLWNKGANYVPGEYNAEIYWKDQFMGNSKFTLK